MLQAKGTRKVLFLLKQNEGRVQPKTYVAYMGDKNQNLNQRPNNLVSPRASL